MKRKLWSGAILVGLMILCLVGCVRKPEDKSENISKNEEIKSEDDVKNEVDVSKNLVTTTPTEQPEYEGKLATISGTVMEVNEEGILLRYGEEGGNVCLLVPSDETYVQVQYPQSESGLMDAEQSQVKAGRQIRAVYHGDLDDNYPARAYGVTRIIVNLPQPTTSMIGVIEEVYETSILVQETNDSYYNSKYYVSASEKVDIFVGGSKTDCSQLKVGQRVLIIYDGVVLESYPGQIPGTVEIIAE